MKILYCFCTDLLNSGNSAGVIFDFAGDESEKQKLTQQLQLPVIVFVDKAYSFIPILQFFYPNVEMNLCVHGALAAAFLLMDQRQVNHITVSNAVGTLFQAIKLENQVVQMKVSEEASPAYTLDPKILGQLLNLTDLNEIAPDLPVTVASVGSPKLFVPLKSTEALASLQPNFELIKQWSLENQINGLYVYAKESTEPLLLQARAFNPKTGQNEDAATGVAAAALSLVLKQNLIIKQGHFIDKPSCLIVSYHNPGEIYVGGKIIEGNKSVCFDDDLVQLKLKHRNTAGKSHERKMKDKVYLVYDEIMDWFDGHRSKELVMEKFYFDLLQAHIPEKAKILDVGCGTGEPIALFLIEQGYQVTGIDASEKMIALCRKRFPNARWLLADMRTLNLQEKFHAVIAWHSFFHLPHDDQRTTLKLLAAMVEKNGLLIFTSGEEHGEVWSDNGGHDLYHASLSSEEYAQILSNCHFKVLAHKVRDPECGEATVWVAKRND